MGLAKVRDDVAIGMLAGCQADFPRPSLRPYCERIGRRSKASTNLTIHRARWRSGSQSRKKGGRPEGLARTGLRYAVSPRVFAEWRRSAGRQAASELLGHAFGRRSGRVALDPVAAGCRVAPQPQRVLSGHPEDQREGREHGEEQQGSSYRAYDTVQQGSQAEPDEIGDAQNGGPEETRQKNQACRAMRARAPGPRRRL